MNPFSWKAGYNFLVQNGFTFINVKLLLLMQTEFIFAIVIITDTKWFLMLMACAWNKVCENRKKTVRIIETTTQSFVWSPTVECRSQQSASCSKPLLVAISFLMGPELKNP